MYKNIFHLKWLAIDIEMEVPRSVEKEESMQQNRG